MVKETPSGLLQPEKLLFAIEANELGLWELNIQTGIGNVDKQWAEMLGYELDEVESTMEFWNKIVHPDDKEGVLAELETYLRGEAGSYSSEYRLRTKDGSWKWILDRGKIIERDKEGQPLTLVGTHKDIQERKSAEEVLVHERNKLEAVIAALGDGLTVQDRDFKIIYQNEIQKKRQGERKGEYCYKAYQGRDDVCEGCLVEKCFHDGQVHRRETSSLNTDGKNIFIEVSACAVRDSHGKIIAAVETVRDITQRKLLERQLQKTQKLEAVGTLAGGIAHDFNNILTAIYGYAELVKLQLPRDSELWKMQEEILRASHRARELVKQILSFSRNENHELQPLQLNSLVKEALKMLRASIPTTIEIKEEMDARTGSVLADPTQIHQVLLNLCTNAYHAMRKNGGTLSIILQNMDIDEGDIRTIAFKTPPGSYVRLTVSDTGHGMEKNVQERIFEPYYTTKEKGEGTGLGLSVAYGIVTSYGGFIDLYSEPQKGTSFNIYFPRIDKPSNEQDEGAQTEDILAGGAERILIVDDEESIVQLERRMLEGLGYRVSSTTSSEEALQMFVSSPEEFDLIITDMTMPVMNGVELSEKIIALRPDMPILLCTGFSDLIDKEKARAIGIRKLFIKPITRKELSLVVRKLLGSAA